MTNYATLADEYLKLSPFNVPFCYDKKEAVISTRHNNTRYKVYWTNTFFSNLQLINYRQEIDCLLEWFVTDIKCRKKTRAGLLIQWKETFETIKE